MKHRLKTRQSILSTNGRLDLTLRHTRTPDHQRLMSRLNSQLKRMTSTIRHKTTTQILAFRSITWSSTFKNVTSECWLISESIICWTRSQSMSDILHNCHCVDVNKCLSELVRARLIGSEKLAVTDATSDTKTPVTKRIPTLFLADTSRCWRCRGLSWNPATTNLGVESHSQPHFIIGGNPFNASKIRC